MVIDVFIYILLSRFTLPTNFFLADVFAWRFCGRFQTITLFNQPAVVYVISLPRTDADVDALAGAVDHNRACVLLA